jgi:lipoprotein-anchoring transpeptidase ErfK/SrfK
MWFHREMADHLQETRRTRQRAPWWALLPLLVALMGIVTVVARSLEPAPADAAPQATTTTTIPATTTTTADPGPPPEVPVTTPLATPKGQIPTFDEPDGQQVGQAGLWYGYPMTMPIVEERDDWLRIMLPERPNQSTAWVRAADVDRSSSPYRIVLRLGETRLYVYQDGFELFSAPVGIGKDSTPTPLGSYFVAVKGAPAPASYGPVILDLSAHSEAIESWEGTGDAITAIHGQLSASSAAAIGTTGTKISNGCIRMLTADQLKMDIITIGTPVDIVP